MSLKNGDRSRAQIGRKRRILRRQRVRALLQSIGKKAEPAAASPKK